jgi:repressor LexA
MHLIQKKILRLLDGGSLENISARQIGLLVGVEHPQQIKHHLNQLEINGLAKYDRDNKILHPLSDNHGDSNLVTLPVYGAANCGNATNFADNYIEGYLKISRTLLNRTDDIIVLEADGDSMNKADLNGKNIEDGDYVIVDTKQKFPEPNDYIVSVIDGMANIKKFVLDKANHQIVLMPESTKNYPPIFIGENEIENYSICGKVVQVIKKPNIIK